MRRAVEPAQYGSMINNVEKGHKPDEGSGRKVEGTRGEIGRKMEKVLDREHGKRI